MRSASIHPRSWTLIQVALTSLALVGLLIFSAFVATWFAWKRSILQSAERMRSQTAYALSMEVRDSINHAASAIGITIKKFHQEGLSTDSIKDWEHLFFTLLHAHSNLSDISFTRGKIIGQDPDGDVQLDSKNRWQLQLFRYDSGIASYWLHKNGEKWITEHRKGEIYFKENHLPLPELKTQDPTLHPTFTTPAREDKQQELIWSDLHWHPSDLALPENQRRIELSAQQAVLDRNGSFIGVVRASLLLDAIEDVLKKAREKSPDHLLFLCDFKGRVISRFDPDKKHQIQDDDELRIHQDDLPEPVKIGTEKLRELHGIKEDTQGFRFMVRGIPYWATFQVIEASRERAVGIIVPESHYVGHLVAVRNQLFLIILGVLIIATALTVFIFRYFQAIQNRIFEETGKFKRLDFSPSPLDTPFRDMFEILENFEKAKTVVRSMGQYLPLDLVRKLFSENQQPTLNAEERELTLLFSDIANFTSITESLPPDRLTIALGYYLETMTNVIQKQHGGTIDKFIGDSVMAFWNAPQEDPDHTPHACQAALDCQEALEKLFKSEIWKDLPPFTTRFGIHRDKVMVGNFGAHDRMNYTAIGDGVNVASRLEGLNKTLGTKILVSDTVYQHAQEGFEFVTRDKMVIKGRKEPVTIFELKLKS